MEDWDLGSEGAFRGGALRGWACARRDRSGGESFRAVARWGKQGAAIQCSLRSSPAAAGVWLGSGCVFVGEGLMEDWDLGSEGAFRGGSAGLGLRSRGSFGVREILLLFYRAAGIETN